MTLPVATVIRYAIPATLIVVGGVGTVVRHIKAYKERKNQPDLVEDEEIRFNNAKSVN